MKVRFLRDFVIFLAVFIALSGNPIAVTWIDTLRGLTNNPSAVIDDPQFWLNLWRAVANFMKIGGIFFIGRLYARSSRQQRS